jgi:hypothetical protein
MNVDGREIILISVYFKYSDNVHDHVRGLSDVLRLLRGRQVLLAGDFNARSPLWFDRPGSDRTGSARPVEEFISSSGLNILNRPGPATFAGPAGESYIDLTLCSDGLLSLLSNWRVLPDAVVCDHRLITWSVGAAPAVDPIGLRSFKCFRPDWQGFASSLDFELRDFDDWVRLDADFAGDKFNSAVVNAAESALGRCKPGGGHATSWWNPDLSLLRRKFKAAERAFRPVRKKEIDRESPAGVRLWGALQRARGAYQKAVRLAKVAAWRDWITDVGNTDPWSVSRTVVKTKKSADHYLTSVITDEGETKSIGDTLKALVDGLVPVDRPDTYTRHQMQLAVLSRVPPRGRGTEEVTVVNREELGEIIKGLGPRKAPGIDRINGIIVKKVWEYCPDVVLRLMQKCLREGVFPRVWKRGLLRVIPKGNDKPVSDLKAYRPITLLPSFGKVLEILVRNRLGGSLSVGSPMQFGFSRGLGTEHAIAECVRYVGSTRSKYVLGVFLDIAGAFDNAWWPMMLAKLKLRGCPLALFNIVSDYFRERSVVIAYAGLVHERAVSMGCPQGSVLGPFLWNVLFDDLLGLRYPNGCSMIAYADDALLLLSGDSRAQIEGKFTLAIGQILEWGSRNRLCFAPAKTYAMWMKGSLGRSRDPVLRMDGHAVRLVDEVRYLGVILDRSFSFMPHVRSIAQRTASMFFMLRRLSGATWGLEFRALRRIYRAAYVPFVTYAAKTWSHRLSVGSVNLALLRSQRLPLLAVTGAYRTAASIGLPVLAGVLPANLETLRAVAMRDLKRGENATLLGTTVSVGSGRSDFNRAVGEVEDLVMDEWQSTWDAGRTARLVYRFLPDVRERMRMSFFGLDHWGVQLVTGHGEFRGKLFQLGLSDNPWCTCGGGMQDAEHILWDCTMLGSARDEMIEGLDSDTPRPVWFGELLRSPANLSCFKRFVKSWVDLWEELRVPGSPPDHV